MSLSEDEKTRMQRLREKRMRLVEEKEQADKRGRHGSSIAERVSSALGVRIKLDDFDARGQLPVKPQRRPNFAEYPGLAAAHISEQRVRELVACCDDVLGPLTGVLTFDEYRYVGTVIVGKTSFIALLRAAKALHDSILFCPEGTNSVVILDHYKVSGMPRDVHFSFIVQGAQLESKLATCFNNVTKLAR